MLIGDKARFAVEIGDYCEGGTALRRVDLWAANRWLSCDDNHAYVGSFVMQVQRTIDRLRAKTSARELAPPVAGLTPLQMYRQASRRQALTRWQLLNWDETTDNFSSYLFRVEDRLVITFEFWREHHEPAEDRGKIFATELPVAEFVEILERMLQVLCADGAGRRSSPPIQSTDPDDPYGGQLQAAVELIRQAGHPAEMLGQGKSRFIHPECHGRAAELSLCADEYLVEFFDDSEEVFDSEEFLDSLADCEIRVWRKNLETAAADVVQWLSARQ